MSSTYISLPAISFTGPVVISQPITVNQGTSPWVVSGTVGAIQSGSWTVAATQSGSWTTGRTWTLSDSTDSVAVSGSVTVSGTITVNQGTSPWVTSVSNFPATVAVTQSTSPWIVNGSGFTQPVSGPLTDTQLRATPVPVSGSVTVSGTVAATQSGTWTVQQGTPPWSVSQSGTWNIGTVTAVTNITNPVAVTQSGSWSTGRTWTLSSGTDSVAVSGSVTVSGTVAATQSGTWNITNISGTISLPTGAATEASLIKPQGSISGGTAGTASQLAGGIYNTAAPTLTNGQQAGLQLDVNGNLKTTATATIAGTVSVTQGTSPWVTSDLADGTVAPGTVATKSMLAGGQYNSAGVTLTNAQQAAVQLNTAGAVLVSTEGQKSTYSAATSFIVAASASDVFTITGSASKTVRINKIGITGTNTGNANVAIFAVRRSTANSGGTSTTLTNIAADSTQAAATATVRSYTVSPTLGSLVGSIRSDVAFFPALASTNAGTDIEYNFGEINCKSIVLRGTSEVLALNMNGVLVTGTTILYVDITWTEE